ncbi:MAG TPA: ribonuclease III [Candidatus Dormibacteraeota bacterium]|nr:ribonuclease III [Candidatus Dormibacteraeota bacterium]
MGVHPGEVGLIAKVRTGGRGRRLVADPQVPTGRLEELQDKVGVAFRDLALLREALTHSSFANESPHVSPRDNERLEYLGDAVLQLITAEYLFKLRPGAKEGEMTQLRSAMVNTNTLAALAEELGLGDFLFLGKGIAKGGGRSLKSLLANAFEAVLGAIFLDAGYDAAYHYYLDRFRALPEPVQDENHKGRLQQVVQERYGLTPYYDSAGARGGRQREYTAVVYAGADPLGTGHGTTKQAAEQEAARYALTELERRSASRKTGGRSRRRAAAEEAAAGEPAAAEEPEVEPGPLEKAVALAAQDDEPEPGPEPYWAVERRPDRPEPAPQSPEPPPPAAQPVEPEAAASPPEAEAPAPVPEPEPKPRRRTRRPRKTEEPPAGAGPAGETADSPAVTT